ncbi:YecA family protein [Pasteurellaceae bacterium LIM206]|nr:YecA family protein [Pasteurellaceae bacterium LIM206]
MTYSTLQNQLKQTQNHSSAAEIHGFLSGLLCGGLHDQSWQPLLNQFTNDNHAYPTALLADITALYQETQQKLSDMSNFEFALLLPDESDVFAQANALADWVNNFLLGLGLAQPKLSQEEGEIAEAIQDLQDICLLGYDEDDDQEELADALEEIVEYVRTLAALFYTHFNQPQQAKNTVLH